MIMPITRYMIEITEKEMFQFLNLNQILENNSHKSEKLVMRKIDRDNRDAIELNLHNII